MGQYIVSKDYIFKVNLVFWKINPKLLLINNGLRVYDYCFFQLLVLTNDKTFIKNIHLLLKENCFIL